MKRRNIRCRELARIGMYALLFSFVFSSILKAGERKASMDAFAKCLAGEKVMMYGSFLCPHCDDQKKIFGDAFKYVPYVECLGFEYQKNSAKLCRG